MDHALLYQKSGNGRGYVPGAFRGLDLQAIRNNPGLGSIWEADFNDITVKPYTLNDVAGGSVPTFTLVTAGTTGQGLVSKVGATAGDGGGPQFTHNFLPAAGDIVGMEFRFKVTTISASPWLFLGLATAGAAVTVMNATSVLASQWLGFWHGTAAAIRAGADNNVTAVNAGTIGALVEDTWCKLSLRAEIGKQLEVWLDGVQVPSATTDISLSTPSAVIVPSLIIQAAGTGTPTMTVDYAVVAHGTPG